MTVFKTFWKVVNHYKGTIILYTVLLVVFGGMNMKSNNQMDFVDSKPDIFIVNKDVSNKITDNLISYMEKNSHIVDLQEKEEKIKDALFYRDVNYVIYIPENYGSLVLNGQNPKIEIESTGDYQASLAEMLLNRYLKIQNLEQMAYMEQNELINAINENLGHQASITSISSLDEVGLTNASNYFNFASYSILAVVILVIGLVLASFNELNIRKRTVTSPMPYQKYNLHLLLSSLLYAGCAWFLFCFLGICLLGKTVLSVRGIWYMLNALFFTVSALALALLISTLTKNKNAMNGIVNIVALGSAFLCGAFVPAEWLPNFVLKIAHILPAYWYINTNNCLKEIENLSFGTLKPILFNFFILILFTVGFILINNYLSRRKQRID